MKRAQKVAALGAASILGVTVLTGAALAATESATGGTRLSEKVAQKFNLNKDEVQKVFDEDRSQREAERETRYEARLDQAIKDGKLTEEQKTKLIAKHKELKATRDAKRQQMESDRSSFEAKGESERQKIMEQRKTEIDAQRAEIESWEKANGIPTGYLMKGERGMGPGGPGSGPGGR